jgi:SpoIIAA-like
MSAEILSADGELLTARITGVLAQPELAALQQSAAGIIRQHGHVRMLIIAEDFLGWQKGGDWDDVSFMENDPYIRKMAIVGDKKWEELALLFAAQTMRKFPIEYFQPADLTKARGWLMAD